MQIWQSSKSNASLELADRRGTFEAFYAYFDVLAYPPLLYHPDGSPQLMANGTPRID